MVEAFADRGEANPVWPSADVLEEALADVETIVEEPTAIRLVAPAIATPGSSDTLFTRG
jgi:hypothetical protein